MVLTVNKDETQDGKDKATKERLSRKEKETPTSA